MSSDEKYGLADELADADAECEGLADEARTLYEQMETLEAENERLRDIVVNNVIEAAKFHTDKLTRCEAENERLRNEVERLTTIQRHIDGSVKVLWGYYGNGQPYEGAPTEQRIGTMLHWLNVHKGKISKLNVEHLKALADAANKWHYAHSSGSKEELRRAVAGLIEALAALDGATDAN